MTCQVPLPSSDAASQFFTLFEAETMARVLVRIPGTLDLDPVLEGGRANHLKFQPIADYDAKVMKPQLTNRVSPSFSNEVLEHPTQEGFSLDHTYEKLNVFDIEATLYEGRVERLTKLNDLRTSKTLLTMVCDMDVYKNYIITDVSPVMHSGSANAFDVSITFQEIRRVELISPSITTYTDVGEVHGNDTKDGGEVTLSLKSQVVIPEEKESIWDKIIWGFHNDLREYL